MFYASAELKTDTLEIDTFESVNRKGILLCARCRSFGPDRFVVTGKAGKSEGARKLAASPVIKVGPVVKIFVGCD